MDDRQVKKLPHLPPLPCPPCLPCLPPLPLYPSRRIEVEQPQQFEELLNCSRVRRIYLDELDTATEPALGVKVVKLVIEPEETAGERARQLITLARGQLFDANLQRDFINLIETIIVYKLPQKSREEIAAMLNLSELKQTRFYQEVKQEGVEEGREEGREEGERQAKLDAIPRLRGFGLSAEQIAQGLNLPLDFVKQTITQIERQSMSFSEKNIETFIELLTQQRTLFSPEQLTELEQIVEPLDDDIDILSEAISSWSENYPEIEAAKFKLLEVLGSQSSEKAPESKQGKVPKSKSNLNKKTLRNAIEQGSKPAESQSSTDDTPEKE